MKIRKKPVEVDAWSVSEIINDYRLNPSDLDVVIRFAIDNNIVSVNGNTINIRVPEGNLNVGTDYYVIRGNDGELYPCRADRYVELFETLDGEPLTV